MKCLAGCTCGRHAPANVIEAGISFEPDLPSYSEPHDGWRAIGGFPDGCYVHTIPQDEWDYET